MGDPDGPGPVLSGAPWKHVPLPIDTSPGARRRVAERDKLIMQEHARHAEHQRELNREAEAAMTPEERVSGLMAEARWKARNSLSEGQWVAIVLIGALFLMAVGVIG